MQWVPDTMASRRRDRQATRLMLPRLILESLNPMRNSHCEYTPACIFPLAGFSPHFLCTRWHCSIRCAPILCCSRLHSSLNPQPLSTLLSRAPLPRAGFSSHFLYARWYRSNADLTHFASQHESVERRAGVSVDEFNAKYLPSTPVGTI